MSPRRPRNTNVGEVFRWYGVGEVGQAAHTKRFNADMHARTQCGSPTYPPSAGRWRSGNRALGGVAARRMMYGTPAGSGGFGGRLVLVVNGIRNIHRCRQQWRPGWRLRAAVPASAPGQLAGARPARAPNQCDEATVWLDDHGIELQPKGPPSWAGSALAPVRPHRTQIPFSA